MIYFCIFVLAVSGASLFSEINFRTEESGFRPIVDFVVAFYAVVMIAMLM